MAQGDPGIAGFFDVGGGDLQETEVIDIAEMGRVVFRYTMPLRFYVNASRTDPEDPQKNNSIAYLTATPKDIKIVGSIIAPPPELLALGPRPRHVAYSQTILGEHVVTGTLNFGKLKNFLRQGEEYVKDSKHGLFLHHMENAELEDVVRRHQHDLNRHDLLSDPHIEKKLVGFYRLMGIQANST
jgi:hypothetical protein